MSQSSVNIEEVDENGGCDYFRWIDPSLENTDESSLTNRFIDGQNLIDRLKRKVKELEEERDSLKFQLNENEEKKMVLNKKLKEVKLKGIGKMSNLTEL
ncbi:hypothetical protein H5410_007347 [Solanum commersonii]|uniref:Uncharacterized protein n=1 Tax=Solanum commersonii TaxID=4109 RepID=A0A9J6ACE5_SOLCO|nr:hypothetical protein H5410_007347 [Solanum commersonii]